MAETRRVLGITFKGDDKLSPAVRVAVAALQTLQRVGGVALNALKRGFDLALLPVRLLHRAVTSLLNPMNLLGAVIGGVIVQQLTHLVTSTIEAASAIDDMSKRTGLSAMFLQTWGHALDQTGSSAADLEKLVRASQKAIQDAQNGLSTATRAFSQLGLTWQELRAKSPEDQFTTIVTRLGQLEDVTKRNGVAMDLFGKRLGSTLNPLLAEGAEGIRALLADAERLGIFTDEQIRRAEEAGDALDRFKRALAFVKHEIVLAFIPALQSLVDMLTNFLANNREDVAAWAKSFADWLHVTTLRVAAFVQLLRELMSDTSMSETLGEVLKAIGTFALKSFQAALLGSLRILSNVLQVASRPLLAVASALGDMLGQNITDGIIRKISEMAGLPQMRVAFEVMFGEGWSGAVQVMVDETKKATDAVEDRTRELNRIIGENFTQMFRDIGTDFNDMGEAATAAIDMIDGAAQEMVGSIGAISNGVPALERFMEAWNTAPNVVAELNAPLETARRAVNAFGDDAEVAAAEVKNLSDTINTLMRELASINQSSMRTLREAQASLIPGEAGAIAMLDAEFEARREDLIAKHQQTIDRINQIHEQLVPAAEGNAMLLFAIHVQRLQQTELATQAHHAALEALEHEHVLRLMEINGTFWDGVMAGSSRIAEQLVNDFARGQAAIGQLMSTLEHGFDRTFDSIITGTESATEAFRKFGQEVLSIIGRIIAKEAALSIVKALIPGFGGEQSKGGGLLDFIFGGGAAHGAVVMPHVRKFANGGIPVIPSSPLMRSAEHFASGGITRAPTLFSTSEFNHPEVVLPLQPGPRGLGVAAYVPPMQQSAGTTVMENITVQINLNVDAMDGESVARKLAEPKIQRQIQDMVVTGLNRRRDFRENMKASVR